jgi:site-specific DNA-methyltransferase (adenine-specific)
MWMSKELLGSLEMNHIYQMDCIEGMKLIPNNSVDLILTDIPYGNVTKNGVKRAKYSGQLRSFDKGIADIETFELNQFLNECYRIMKGSIYIFCGIEQISPIFSFFDSKSDLMVRQAIWRKTNPSPVNGQHMWLHAIENCVFAKKRKTTFNQHCKQNVWDFPIERQKLHPTQKPLKLFQYLIESSTNEGDIVLDTCMGSGTTAVACEISKRKWIGFETEPKYIEIANKRLEEWR